MLFSFSFFLGGARVTAEETNPPPDSPMSIQTAASAAPRGTATRGTTIAQGVGSAGRNAVQMATLRQ